KFFLGRSDGGNLRDRVDPDRKVLGHDRTSPPREPERMHARDPSLLHAGRSESGSPDHIACSIDVGNARPEILIDFHKSAIVDLDTDLFETESFGIAASALGNQNAISLKFT